MASRRNLSDLVAGTTSPRLRVPYGVSIIVAILLHVCFLVLFLATGVWPLAILNVASIVIFLLLLVMVLRDHIPLGIMLGMAEVVGHAILATHYVGWDAGFQYYVLAVFPMPMLLPTYPRWVRFGTPVVLLSTFLGLLVVYLGSPPPYQLDGTILAFTQIGNLLGSFVVLWFFTYFYQRGAELAEGALTIARERSEQLLHAILPPSIVARLRREPGVVADAVDGASILFADLVGFTPLAEQKGPEELVVLLDAIVGAFDDLVEERGLEKIKTIGDAYMAASGVPRSRKDHAQAMADLALAMRERFEAVAKQLGASLAMRIGIHSGPVVAGVIGKSKFAYDLWGDTVNTAARMESHGEPGKIHVTEATVRALGDGWVVEERGAIEVKGKGSMRTYWLIGRTEAALVDAGKVSAALP